MALVMIEFPTFLLTDTDIPMTYWNKGCFFDAVRTVALRFVEANSPLRLSMYALTNCCCMALLTIDSYGPTSIHW